MYNVSEDAGKAAILVISQVEDHRVQVTLTLTSTDMRNLPSPEEAEGMYSLVSIPCFHSPILMFPYFILSYVILYIIVATRARHFF